MTDRHHNIDNPPAAARELTAAEQDAASRQQTRLGLAYAAGAYLWWGFATLYFALVAHIPPMTVLAHRIVWSIVFLGIILSMQRRWGEVVAVCGRRRMLAGLTITAVFIGINWYVFIYAVTTEQVLQASLGYYINPLVCVLLGMIFLGERLRRWQWLSVTLAFVGVLISAMAGNGVLFPWIALTLATSFGLYGLLRKVVPVGPMIGLLIESTVLLPAAMLWLGINFSEQTAALPWRDHGLLALAGIVTAVPLLWFANAARRLRLSTVGLMQYIAPTTQMLVAVTILGETLDAKRLLSFAFIWLALAIFSIDAWQHHRMPASSTVEMAE